jgi:alkaline phosphatase D
MTPTTLAPVELSGDPFTLGIASGDPGPGRVVLWTRLAPDPLHGGGMPDDDVDVVWEVATDDAFTDVVAQGTITAEARYAHSVHAVAELDAGWHHYRFRVGQYTSPVGRTQVAPGSADRAVFASASCQNYQDGFYTAHRDLAAQEPDFVMWLGDYIYESGAAEVGGDVVRSHGTPEPTDLAAYRDRYALYKSDPDLQASHAAAPWYVIWDDHEVENNYAGLTPQDDADAAGFAERRRQAYQAWWEHQPVDLPPPPDDGSDYRIYRERPWGGLLDITLLDGRQYRTDQACGDVTLNLDPPCAETFDADRTMLGDEQEQWLLDTLAASTATWNVIGQQTIFGDVTLGGAVLNYDQWDGYPVERNRIVDSFDATTNQVVLTGDIHFGGAGIIRSGGRGTGTPVGVEFVATSISSGGLVDPAVTDVVKAIPDVVDAELDHRGYVLHTVTPEMWSAEFRMVTSVKVPDSDVFVHATYAVAAGTNVMTIAAG